MTFAPKENKKSAEFESFGANGGLPTGELQTEELNSFNCLSIEL